MGDQHLTSASLRSGHPLCATMMPRGLSAGPRQKPAVEAAPDRETFPWDWERVPEEDHTYLPYRRIWRGVVRQAWVDAFTLPIRPLTREAASYLLVDDDPATRQQWLWAGWELDDFRRRLAKVPMRWAYLAALVAGHSPSPEVWRRYQAPGEAARTLRFRRALARGLTSGGTCDI